jgi:hypothetical protein
MLKINQTCLFRYGVENSQTQSFIACMASAKFYAKKDSVVPSIVEMKKIILDAINLDLFMKYQNGDLIESFANKSDLSEDIDVEKEEYKETKIYKKNNKEFLKKVVQSYENFKKYILDDDVDIDHKYLWDLVCDPNPKLFEKGLNLIIFDIPEDDLTMNINIVCPSNHYSSQFFDIKKPLLFLVKREKYFEPIYLMQKIEKKNKLGFGFTTVKTFSLEKGGLISNIKNMAEKILIPIMENKCGVFSSKPKRVYKFDFSPLLDNLIKDLVSKNYEIKKQVLNFQGKVIGLLVNNSDGNPGFIPCYPSAITSLKKPKCKNKTNELNESNQANEQKDEDNCEYDYVYMTDDIWLPYDKTFDFLTDYEHDFDIKYKNGNYSFVKVVDYGVIVGFLTNTNQFVKIDPPMINTETNDDVIEIIVNDLDSTIELDEETIKKIGSKTMNESDANIQLNGNIDTERTEFIKKIQLETNYYNAFRNTIRILLNDYSNNKLKKKIYNESKKKDVFYIDQINSIKKDLITLVGNHIVFVNEGTEKGMHDYRKVDEKNITTCIQPNNKCNDYNIICRLTEDPNGDTCSLILPKQNLITKGSDNEKIYYEKMADELIRYNRIKSFIFKPHMYLSFGKVKYNLKNDEMIILQDLLTPEFFENLVPSNKNKYAHFNTFDTAKPLETLTYDNKIEDINKLDELETIKEKEKEQAQDILMDKCKTDTTILKWKDYFPTDYKLVEYNNSKTCSIRLLIDIVNNYTKEKEKLTFANVKKTLINQYKTFLQNKEDNKKLITSERRGVLLISKTSSLFDSIWYSSVRNLPPQL